MQPTARAVIFDMGNVLVSIDNRRSLAAFQQHLSGALDPRALEALLYGASGATWNEVDPTGLIEAFHRGAIDTPTFVARVRQRIAFAATLDEALFARLWPDRFARNEATLELVRRLEPHRRYLLSDANDLDISWHRRHNPDIFALFDALFLLPRDRRRQIRSAGLAQRDGGQWPARRSAPVHRRSGGSRKAGAGAGNAGNRLYRRAEPRAGIESDRLPVT